MRRWNGWGDDTIEYTLRPTAEAVIQQQLGPSTPPHDTNLTDLVKGVPTSRLPPHPLVLMEASDRIRHARGQSLPDLIAMRAGFDLTFPDGVAYPTSEADVRDLISYARDADIRLIPYGGGTSVVGHVNVIDDTVPILTVDLGRLSSLEYLDRASHLATFGAGISGAYLEARLRAQGYIMGHFPQSFDYSTLGGWIATRSKGQQSLHYGGIDKMFAGGRVETPAGCIELPALVASAAGPDIREIILGSEGRLGIITSATVRVQPLPAYESFRAVFFPDFEHGIAAIRELARSHLPLSMLRLSDPTETAMTLALAGHRKMIDIVQAILHQRGIGAGQCMLLLGVTGGTSARAAVREALHIARRHRGIHIAGEAFGNQWRKSRFRTPYLRNTLWEKGYSVETVETAADWSQLLATKQAIESSLRSGLQEVDERVFCFTHLSHVYPTGSSIYTTYLYRIAPDPAETLRRWQVLKAATSNAIVKNGATISHQHGVGTDHLPYLTAEKGHLAIEALHALSKQFDPQGIMNPGKLIPSTSQVIHVDQRLAQ